jgi:hypothetical protein
MRSVEQEQTGTWPVWERYTRKKMEWNKETREHE